MGRQTVPSLTLFYFLAVSLRFYESENRRQRPPSHKTRCSIFSTRCYGRQKFGKCYLYFYLRRL